MITQHEIETFAAEMAAEPGFERANIDALIGHLSDAEIEAVMDRAEQIAHERAAAYRAEADELGKLRRLAQAADCPTSVPAIIWLQERGLIEEIGGGWRFKTQPAPVAT